MPSTEPASAIVARIPIPRSLARLRARWDSAASVGVPPHVTIIFPFLPAGRLGPEVRRTLAGVLGTHDPVEVRFEQVGRFPTVVYLAPEPSTPFTHLTDAVVGRYPDFPPYGGAFDVVIPHLTVTESADAPLDEIARQAAASLPFAHRVDSLEVLVEDGNGRWRAHWHIRLGVKR